MLTEQGKGAHATVMRVPVLYGKTEYHSESAVNVLVDGELLRGFGQSVRSS